MQFFREIEGQLLWALRFDDSFVLLEDASMLGVELFVGFHVAIVAAGEAMKFGFVIRNWRTEINIRMALDASWLVALNDHHKGQYDGVELLGGTAGAKSVDWRIDLVLKPTLNFSQIDRGRFGLIGIPEDSGVDPRKVGKISKVFDHARRVGSPLAFRCVGFPVEARIAEFGGELGNLQARFAEADPHQSITLPCTKHFSSGFRRNFSTGRQRRYACAAAVARVIPTVIAAHQLITLDATERKRCAAMNAEIVECRYLSVGAP